MMIFGNKELSENAITRSGAYAILKTDNKAGIIKNDLGYFLIGGGHEEGETDRECLVREALEETGYNLEVGEYLEEISEYVYVPEWDKTFCKVMRVYKAQLMERVSEKTEKDHELIWVDLNFAIEKMYLKGQIEMLKKHFD